jgi:predicted transcriptional regulator
LLLPKSDEWASEGDMKAMDVMVRDVITVRPDDEVAAAIKLLANTTSVRCRWSTMAARSSA